MLDIGLMTLIVINQLKGFHADYDKFTHSVIYTLSWYRVRNLSESLNFNADVFYKILP